MSQYARLPTEIEIISSLTKPIWEYYRRHAEYIVVPKSIQDNFTAGRAELVHNAFPHLSQRQAAFLSLVEDIITGQDPMNGCSEMFDH